jgi:hypothetical protein
MNSVGNWTKGQRSDLTVLVNVRLANVRQVPVNMRLANVRQHLVNVRWANDRPCLANVRTRASLNLAGALVILNWNSKSPS